MRPDEPHHPHHPHHLPIDPDLDGADEVVPGRPSMEHWDVVAVVAVGGALGGGARYLLGEVVGTGPGFPWATFLENVLGCLLLGALMVVLVELRPPNRYARPFLGIGVLGGFTTFSAYTNEARTLASGGRAGLAAVYVAVSLGVGIVATVAGIAVTRAVADARLEDAEEIG